MILNSPYISGSLTVTGNTTIQGQLTVTGSLSGTASLASNALLLQGTGSTGFATTSSINEVSASQQSISASLLQVSASYIALSGSYNTFSGSASTRITANSSSIQQISASLLQVSASYIALSGSYTTFSGSASTRTTQIEQIYATTGSNSFRANQSITGSLVVSSTITAQTLVVQTVTSSIIYSSGSNLFGNQLANTQTFTGSVNITGSLALAGNITGNAITLTGALSGTSATFSSNSNSTIVNSFQNTNTTNTNSRNMLNVTAGNVTLQFTAIHGDNVYISPSTAVSTYLGYNNTVQIASSGAATFSSSVTATQIISNYAGKDGLIVSDSRTQAAGVGGSILFKGVYTNGGSPLDFGRISLMKENSTNADYSFGMGFYTSANGGTNPSTNPNMSLKGNGELMIGYVNASNDAMVLKWNGASSYGSIQTFSSSILALNPSGNNVLIGTTSGPSDGKLVISNGGAEGLEFSVAIASNENRILSYNRASNTYNRLRFDGLDYEFRTSNTPRLTITSAGAATFSSSVTATSFIGGLYAPTYNNGTTFINFYDSMGSSTSRAAIIYNSADSPTAGGMWTVQFVKWDGAYGSMTALNMEPGTQNFYVKTLYGGTWSSWVQK